MNDYKMNSEELRATWSLGAILSLRMLGMFMVTPVLATYGMELKGASETLIGLAIGIYSLMQSGFQIPLGFLSDRIGRRPIIIGGLIIFIIGSVISALSYSIWGIIFGRALQGSGAISSVIMAWLSELTREQNRTKAMAFLGISLGITFSTAIVLGPIITNFFGLRAIFLIITFLSTINILLTMWVVPSNNNQVPDHDIRIITGYLRTVLFEPRLLKLNFSIMCLHILLMTTFIALPIQLTMVGFPSDQHWKIYLLTMLISFFCMIPFIIYAEMKHCIKRIFLLCIILLLNSEILFLVSDSSFYKIVVGIQIFFFAFNLIESLLPSILSKESPVGYKGTVMGVYSTSQCIGVTIGSILGGWAVDFFNSRIVFLMGVLLTVIWLLIVAKMKEPPYYSNLCINIPDNIQINEELKIYLKKKEGISEILIVPEERNLYVKIDNKMTNRHEIEQAVAKTKI